MSGEGSHTMQLGQIASIWMMYGQEERPVVAPRHASDVAPRPSIAQRFGGKLRRIAYRAQLGPVAGPAAV
jgi:hypothetical protein